MSNDEDGNDDADDDNDLVSETEPFADRLGDICGRLVWQLLIQVDCLHKPVTLRWRQVHPGTQVPRVSGTQVNPGIRYIDSCFSSHPPFKGG